MPHDPKLCFPIPPKCSSYVGRTRCPNTATHRIYAPDGLPNPGGWVCGTHGQEITDEYKDKLDEAWTLKPLHRYAPETCDRETK